MTVTEQKVVGLMIEELETLPVGMRSRTRLLRVLSALEALRRNQCKTNTFHVSGLFRAGEKGDSDA